MIFVPNGLVGMHVVGRVMRFPCSRRCMEGEPPFGIRKGCGQGNPLHGMGCLGNCLPLHHRLMYSNTHFPRHNHSMCKPCSQQLGSTWALFENLVANSSCCHNIPTHHLLPILRVGIHLSWHELQSGSTVCSLVVRPQHTSICTLKKAMNMDNSFFFSQWVSDIDVCMHR